MRALFIVLIFGFFTSKGSAQMILSGTATGACDCYELTDFTNESGSIWSPGTISLANPFDFTFNVNLGVDDVWGADGMVFALRQSGTSSGAIGNGMGYGGISPSVGVEIDTWNSSPTVPTDIASDHLGMSANGLVNHGLVGTTAIPNIEDGAYHLFRAVWDPVATDLEIWLNGTLYFTYTGDLVALYFGGNPNVYFGWTGGTGGVDNIQSVCMYRTADFTRDYVTACVDQTVTFTDISSSDLIYNGDEAVTWAWNFGDGGTSSLENPTHAYAAAGTYTVTLTITDVSGCSSTVTHDITITAGLAVTMTHTDVTCFGLDDGTGTATPTTGTGPYTFVWDDPLVQVTGTAVDLAPTTYNVIVTDALGCVGSGSVTILEPPALVLDAVAATNASCGLANGTITITASGGTPALEYSIDGGVTFFPTGSFTGLINATYNVVVRDANNCTVTTTIVVGLDSPLVIDDVTVTDVSCGPTDDGTITITASAGVPPFQYSIDGGITYQPSNFFDLLPAGSYTVMVMDGAGCTVSMPVVVGSLSLVVIDALTITDATCNGGFDGGISIVVSGGTGPYQYSIDGGVTFFATGVYAGLPSGTYNIEVMDDVGCSVTDVAIIGEPTAITIDAVINTDVSCNALSDGAFELVVSGGTPGYTYSNDGGVVFQVSPVFSGLPAGTYDIVIEDANGCTIASTVDVLEPLTLVIDAVAVVDVTCNGLMDGEVTINASGGTVAYQYRIDGGAYQLSPTFTGLGGGAIVAEVMDANGCTATADAFLAEADPIIATLGPDTTICLGGMATLCPTVVGGTAPYTYIWDAAAGPICLNTAVIGPHTLEVSDVNGCTSELVVQTVNQYIPLSVLATSSTSICPGDDIVIAGEADGEGPAGYTYEWTNDVDATVLSGPVQTVNPMVTTTYTLTVTSGCENSASTSLVVTTYPIPTIFVNADVYDGCQPLEVNLSSSTTPALVSSISWTLGDGSNATGSTVNHTYVDADCYDVVVDVVTINDCPVSATFGSLICAWQMPVADFSYNPEQPDLFSRTVYFENESEYATDYTWSFGDGGGSSDFSPEHTYAEAGNATYRVELTAETDKGCIHSTVQFITIDEIVLYYIPNAFTANSDPFNQTFNPVFLPGFNPEDFHLSIFNRWGELVWESYNPNAGWDGTYDGVLVDDGVYIWELSFRENKSDKKYRDFGHVTILK